jgi:formylglycine-generating enzyme required for sulfatase activity
MPPSSPTLTIHRRQAQNRYFDEVLTESLVLRLMLIPAGSFMMGSPDNELERSDAEGPQHEVNVNSFIMGKYPVTQDQWRYVAERLPQEHQELNPDPSSFKGDRRPVETVNWDDAMEFCARLSEKTGREYRLPTEAEWEYACRAGTTTPFHFGETITTDLANYAGTDEKYGAYGDGPKGEYRGETTPIGHFKVANGWGLCDMHGTVWEWCLDHWHDSYKLSEGQLAPTDGSAWLSEPDNGRRVLRGGSWDFYPRYCRSAYRGFNTRDGRNFSYGFRVVSVAPRTLS